MEKGIFQRNAQMDFVDNIIEDEAERQSLLAKPTCFIIIGRPGVGKSTLAKKIAESWKCVLIDDTDLLNTHINDKTEKGIKLLKILSEGKSIPEDEVLQLILAKLNSPEVEHYGYVLSCLPFMSEECLKIHEQIELIKKLKLTPDFIINIKCADKDLVHRLSGLKQHPESVQLYNREQWMREEVYTSKKNKDEEGDDEEEQTAEEELQREFIDQMVWTPENLARNAFTRINMYRDTMLRQLEDYMMNHNPLYLLELDGNNTIEELYMSVMSNLGSMAIQHVSIPILLHQNDDEELPEDVDTEDLLRIMSSHRMVAPGFRWRRSRWGRNCPVALKEGQIIPGKPELSVGFQDKLYILSSQEAYHKFVTNPRQYLLPPMPRPPCKVCIIGPPQAGKSTLCKLLAQHYNALVLDMEELAQPFLAKAEEERLEKVKEETTQAAIDKIKKDMEDDGGQNTDETKAVEVTDDHPAVKAMVLSALEEAKKQSISPSGLFVEVLENRAKEIEVADTDAEVKTGWVLDNFPKNFSQLDALQHGEILPDIIFCLKDIGGNEVLKRLYEKNKESVDTALRKRLQNEQSEKEKQASNKKEPESEAQSKLDTVVEETGENIEQTDTTAPHHPGEKEAVMLPDLWELGYPEGPEMNDYKQQVQQFTSEWERMQSSLSVAYSVLEIDGKSPEDLLQEMILQMEKPFYYVPWELSTVDVDEEVEDIEALAELERTTKGGSDNNARVEEEEGDTPAKRLLGDTHHFCPVALKNHNVLWPCTDEIAAKYREKIFYFSSSEARDVFLQNPRQFVAKTEPLKPPALRVILLGARGSGKTFNGEWLAKQLGLFHIQFREHLQTLIMAKTKKRVPHADEVVTSEESLRELMAQIKRARDGDGDEDNMNDTEQEVILTDDEKAIKAYLTDGEPLTPRILDMVIALYWKQEPYKSTGFILEGFPNHPDEVQYMLQQQLFPDIVVIMAVEMQDIQKRLLPTYLKKWRNLHNRREALLNILRDLHKKKREDNIAKRRAELMADKGIKSSKTTFGDGSDEEEEEAAVNAQDDIEALLDEEFPLEEENKDRDDEETENAATERMKLELEDHFITDENNLATVMELLSEQNIPIISFMASRKARILRHKLLQKMQPLVIHRESLFQKCQPISHSLAQKLLLSSYKFHSAFGCLDPIEQYKERVVIQPRLWPLDTTYPLIFHLYIYFFASRENRSAFMLNPLKYLRQPKPTPPLPIKIAVVGPPKSGKTSVAQSFAQKYGLTRLSIGGVIRMVLTIQGHTDLAAQIKKHLSQGLTVPDELAIQCLEVALMSSACTSHGYVLDGFPITLKQTELMTSRSIIPYIVVELELDIVAVLKRGLVDKMKPNKPYLMHDSSEIFHIRNSCYKQEVEQVRKHFQQQHQNWIVLDGVKNKWWIYGNILNEVSTSMTYIHNYLKRTHNGQAACINRLCITPKELLERLGEFGQYCPVCLALHYHLVDCSEIVALTHAAVYRGQYYKICGEDHLETFLCNPDKLVSPGCPHTLPPPHLLPRKLTEIQVKNKFPQKAEMKGFCPVTYLDGKQRYEALIRGNVEYAVEYRKQIYVFETKQKQDMFLRSPETYWNQRLPSKVPPLCEPVPLTSLPTLGYLEQGVAVAVIKAMTAVGCHKPKYPFLTIQRSALLYVAFYLKAFNHNSTDYTRKKYKKKLALFEENCALIPYLSSTMRGHYRPSSERPIDFEFKLNRFLALEVLPRASDV